MTYAAQLLPPLTYSVSTRLLSPFAAALHSLLPSRTRAVTRAADDDLGAARAAVRSVVASAAKRFGAVGIAALPLSAAGEDTKTALLDVTSAQWGAACAARARVRELALAWSAAASATLVLAGDTLPWGASGRLAAAVNAGALRGLGAELRRAGAGRSRCVGVNSDASDAALRSCVRRAAWHALHDDAPCGLLWTAMSTSVDHDRIVRATADQEKRAGFGRDTVVERAWGLLEELPSSAQLATLLSDTATLGEGGAGGGLAAMASGSHVTAEQLMSQLSAAGDGDVGRATVLISFIQGQLRQMLGGQTVGAEVPFLEGGVDSLLSIELMNAINDSLSLRVTPAAMLEYPTIAALSDFLVGMLPRTIRAAAPTVPVPPSSSPLPSTAPSAPAAPVVAASTAPSVIERSGNAVSDASGSEMDGGVEEISLPGEEYYIRQMADTFIGMSNSIVRTLYLRAVKSIWLCCCTRRAKVRRLAIARDSSLLRRRPVRAYFRLDELCGAARAQTKERPTLTCMLLLSSSLSLVVSLSPPDLLLARSFSFSCTFRSSLRPHRPSPPPPPSRFDSSHAPRPMTTTQAG